MQITAKANVVLTVTEEADGSRTRGAHPKDVRVVVSLDPGEAIRVHEEWGGKRHFEIVAFSWTGGSHGYARGRVVRKDGTVGTAIVSRAAFPIDEVPLEIRNRAADVLTAVNRYMDETVVAS